MDFPKLARQEVPVSWVLHKATCRLTFDIIYQHPLVTYQGPDDGDYYKFVASNGYEIISRSRMDIQTERLWLRGGRECERSGTMIFATNADRDKAYMAFKMALFEFDHWVTH
jgi:hypothetical protein